MRLTLTAVLATIALAIPAGAQKAPADLVAAYKAGVAGQKCDLGLDSDKSSRLGDAVAKAEQKSGLAQEDLDALWSETEAAADADTAAFCADAAGLIDKVIGK
jgi:hypothetical protein